MHVSLNLTVTVLPLLLFLLLAHGGAASATELRSLLEFKKGIRTDPLGKVHGSWNPSSVTDPNSCPRSWHGIACDESGNVVSISLDRLGLDGELKFFTLVGLTNLRNLSLSGNLFTGRLVPAMGSMSSLQHLDLSSNKFYGPIPARINQLWNLNYVNLSSNDFEGGFPSGIHNLQQLRVLDFHSNKILGDVEVFFSELGNVEFVDLSCNSFHGSLAFSPENISSLANTVRHVNISHNALNGEFLKRDSIDLLRNLEILDLGDNLILGELPSLRSLSNLQVLRLGNNQLFGSIPEELLEGLLPLVELDLSGNGFTGIIPRINSTTLNLLNLSSNGLSGSLPPSLGGCVIVDLSQNSISGDISIMQRWESNLEVLDLSSNKLTGTFPNLISQFQNLLELKIKNNSLVGNLPSAIGTYPRLTVVDLSTNELNGPIPHGFFISLTLKYLNLSGNQFTGAIPFEGSHTNQLLVLSSYPPLDSLDLSSNYLSGTLPSDIGKMEGLTLLNLARNNLSGQIPAEMSKLTELRNLDLSGNKFSGNIPDNLPSSSLTFFNVSNNNLSGRVPENLRNFPFTSFRPGNALLILPNGLWPQNGSVTNAHGKEKGHNSSISSIKVAVIVASVGVSVMIAFVLLAYNRAHQGFHGRSGFHGQTTGRDIKLGRSLFKFHPTVEPPPSSLIFSNDHLLTATSRSLSPKPKFATEIVEHVIPEPAAASCVIVNSNVPETSGRKSSPGSPLSSSPRYADAFEQSVILDVRSPDRLAGQLFFLDTSVTFTAEQLSRAPAEVLGRSSHGTLYKATIDSGHMLTVKWLRVGLVKNKKEFSKEVRRIGCMRHPHVVPLHAYYWGPREQERLILADYICGDSLALHLYETTPRRYSPLSFTQRLKVAVEVAQGLSYLHDNGLTHGNLKPTNILLSGPHLDACITDYALHRLMMPAGISEQILNLGALGYCAPELANVAKPVPTFKTDVYAFGVIVMELLTRRSAGDIISGQTGAVDLTDWVRMCDQEGRGRDCIDRYIGGGEEPSKAMDDLLTISLRCILPVNERPNMRQVLEDLSSICA